MSRASRRAAFVARQNPTESAMQTTANTPSPAAQPLIDDQAAAAAEPAVTGATTTELGASIQNEIVATLPEPEAPLQANEFGSAAAELTPSETTVVITVHTIKITDEYIAPGSAIEIDLPFAAELVASGAVRYA